jgi:limonene-1,2-epoxide hydrolase
MSHPRRTFLATAGISVLTPALARLSARPEQAQRIERAAEWTAEQKANVQLVTDFCASWSTRDLKQILPRLSNDCIYRMSETIPAVTGHAGVTEKLGEWMTSSDLGIEFKILDTWAAGPMVMNHRIDSFKSSKRPLTWEGIGIFFVKDGRIKEWSDYTIRVTR